jgi:TP901 family phage tail tape measure protein
MADEVVIKFTGEGGSLLSTTKAISGEVKTLGDLFDKLKNQGKNSFVENAKGVTALASALGSSYKNAKEFAASIGLSATAATQATQRLKELDGAGASLGVKFRALRSEFGLTRQAFESLNGTYNQNTKAQQQLAQTMGITIGAARNLANGLGLSATQANTAVERYRELAGVGATLAEKQRVLTQELGLTNDQFKQIRGTALATREGLTAIAATATGVAAALGAIGGKGVQVFAEFDKEIRTFAVTSKATPDQVAAITDRIEQLAQVSGKTPQELAATTTELARTGFTAEQIAASMEGLAFASIATGENLGRTGEVFASTVTQFKVASKDFDKIADILVTGANASAGGIDSIGEGLKYVGTSAKAANQSAEETVKTLAILSNVGLKGSIGGTSLDEFLRRLSLTSAQAGTDLTELRTKGGKAAVTAFKLIGASVRDARGELLPISTIIPKLRESLASLDAGDKSLVLNQIFGAQGGRAALALLDATGDVVAKVDSEFATLEGTAKRTGEALNQGPAAGMAKLRAASDTALKAIGGFLAQGFVPLIDVSGALLSTFNSLPAPMQGAIVAVGSLAAALASATAAIATYKLLNAGLIIEQTIVSAGIIRETVVRGAATAATIAQTVALRGMAIAQTQVSGAAVKTAIATRAMAIAQATVAAASAAWAAVTSGAVVPALASGAAAAGTFAASMLAFLPVIVAVAGALALFQEATRKTEQEKFRDDIDKSIEAVRKLRGEVAQKPANDIFQGLAKSYDEFGKRLQERGFIGAMQATIADLTQTLGIGAGAAAKFGDQWSFITREQLGAQQATLSLEQRLVESAKVSGDAAATLNKFGLATLDAGDKQRLGAKGIAEYNAAAATQVKAIDTEIEALKALAARSNDPVATNSLNGQIAALEGTKRALANRSAALAGDGKAQDAQKEKVKSATKSLEEQKAKLDEVKKAIDAIGENVKAGTTSESAAETELNKIIEANKGNVAAQNVAKDEILKIKKSQLDAELALISAGEAAIGAAVANGTKGEAQAEQELTTLKIAEIEKRIAANQLEQASATGSGKAKLIAEQKKLSADLGKAKADQAEADRKNELKDFDEKLSILEASFAQQKTSEEDYLKQKQELQTGQADKEIAQLQEQQSKLSAADTQGQEAIAAKIADVQVKRAKIVEEAQTRAISKLKENQDKALAIVQQSEQERLIAIQKGVNAGVLTEEQAGKLKTNAARDRIAAELDFARKAEADLAAIEGGNLSAEGAKKLEAEKQQARQKTTALTLSLLEQERAAQEALRREAIAGIDRELAATLRRFDADLRGLAATRQARALAIQEAELGAQRQAAALDLETRSLERQGSLIGARANLQKAQANAAEATGNIELDKTKRAIELRKQLDSGGGSDIERIAAAKELARLGISSGQNQLQLLQRQQAQENALAKTKKAALDAEQAQARAGLDLEIRKNDLASQRQLIEAQISESKAKAAVIDAQIAAQEQKRSAARALAEAQAAKARAEQLAPGADRTQAIAAATDQIAAAKQQSTLGNQAATFGIAAAQQQADLAVQNTAAVQAQIANQAEINTLAQQALTIEQQTAQAQFAAAESSRLSAQSLDQARVFSEQIAAAAEREAAARERSRGGGVTPIPRFAGGPVSPGNVYEMAERGPEMVTFGGGGSRLIEQRGLYTVPAAARVHTAVETRAMLARSVPSASGTIATRSASSSGPKADPLLDEMRRTRRAIEARKQLPPANITVNSGDDRTIDRTLRSIIRSRY